MSKLKPVNTEIDELVSLGSLSRRIELMIFAVNVVLTILSSILVIRQRISIFNVMQSVPFELSSFEQIVLSPVSVAILPVLGLLGIAMHFSRLAVSTKLRFHWGHLFVICILTGVYVATTMPIINRLIEHFEN